MRIVGYTYEADTNCISCAQERFLSEGINDDEHGIPQDAIDREGNLITPIFSSDPVTEDIACNNCFDIIVEY